MSSVRYDPILGRVTVGNSGGSGTDVSGTQATDIISNTAAIDENTAAIDDIDTDRIVSQDLSVEYRATNGGAKISIDGANVLYSGITDAYTKFRSPTEATQLVLKDDGTIQLSTQSGSNWKDIATVNDVDVNTAAISDLVDANVVSDEKIQMNVDSIEQVSDRVETLENESVSGDLSGSFDNATVSGINGCEIVTNKTAVTGRVMTVTDTGYCGWVSTNYAEDTLNITSSSFVTDANYFMAAEYPSLTAIKTYAKAVKCQNCMIRYTWTTSDNYDASMVFWVDNSREPVLIFNDDGANESSDNTATVISVTTPNDVVTLEVTSEEGNVSNLQLIRTGNVVQFVWAQVIDMSVYDEGVHLFTLPEGFRPMFLAEFCTTLLADSQVGSCVFNIDADGVIKMWGNTSDNEYYRISGTFITIEDYIA